MTIQLAFSEGHHLEFSLTYQGSWKCLCDKTEGTGGRSQSSHLVGHTCFTDGTYELSFDLTVLPLHPFISKALIKNSLSCPVP